MLKPGMLIELTATNVRYIVIDVTQSGHAIILRRGKRELVTKDRIQKAYSVLRHVKAANGAVQTLWQIEWFK